MENARPDRTCLTKAVSSSQTVPCATSWDVGKHSWMCARRGGGVPAARAAQHRTKLEAQLPDSKPPFGQFLKQAVDYAASDEDKVHSGPRLLQLSRLPIRFLFSFLNF